jgi:hypothetical protein
VTAAALVHGVVALVLGLHWFSPVRNIYDNYAVKYDDMSEEGWSIKPKALKTF